MLKRECTSDSSGVINKVQKLAPDEQSTKVNIDSQFIPDEIISYIFTFCRDIEDIRKCSVLSKTMPGWINIEPTLKNNIKYSLKNVRKKDCLKFINKNGYFVRCLEIEGYWRVGSSINFKALPRLKELAIQSLKFFGQQSNFDGLNLPNLRCLTTFNMTDLEDLIYRLRNTRNLIKFNAQFDNNSNHEIWTNFIFQQYSLKELSLKITSDSFNFPYRDVKSLIKFKLQTLKLSLPRIDQNWLFTFLNTQKSDFHALDLQITDQTVFPSRNINNEVKFRLKKLKLFIFNPHNENFQPFIESQVEQLEELDLEIESDTSTFLDRPVVTIESFKLTRLKLCLKNVKHENLLDLLTKLNNLKELELCISDMDLDKFPCRDISTEMTFRLNKFTYSLPDIDQKRFVDFLTVQAESLEELEINSIDNSDLLDQMFKNLKNIKKLIIDEDVSQIIFDDEFPKFVLKNLRYFEDKNQAGTIVAKLFVRFPNIETLKCCDTMQAKGTYPKLTTFDVSDVYWPRIADFKLPNLKNFYIKKVEKLDDDNYWTSFPNNLLNVENISVQSVGFEDKDVLRFVERLKAFKNLKTFKIRHGIAMNHDYNMDGNERVEADKKFYKILVDTRKRTIRVSTYIVKNRLDILKVLRKTFDKFDFFEFCFEELQMKKIFGKKKVEDGLTIIDL